MSRFVEPVNIERGTPGVILFKGMCLDFRAIPYLKSIKFQK